MRPITSPATLSAATVTAAAAVLLLAGCSHTPGGAGQAPVPTQAIISASTLGVATSGAPLTSSTPTAPMPTRTAPANAFGSVDGSDPTAVAEAMVTAAFTSSTRTDTRPFDATRRALIWYTPTAVAKVRAEAPTGPVGAEWITWTAHKVTTAVQVGISHDAGAPADTPTGADRQLQVRVTPRGADGWTSAPEVYQCFVTLTRVGAGPWQVADLAVTQ